MELAELGKLVDDFNVARNLRLAADKDAKRLKSIEVEMKDRILGEMIEQQVGFAAGMDIRVKRKTVNKPQAADWDQVYKYMVENDAMDLVQKRLNATAVNNRFEDGISIPGIEFYEVNDLSIGKL